MMMIIGRISMKMKRIIKKRVGNIKKKITKYIKWNATWRGTSRKEREKNIKVREAKGKNEQTLKKEKRKKRKRKS